MIEEYWRRWWWNWRWWGMTEGEGGVGIVKKILWQYIFIETGIVTTHMHCKLHCNGAHSLQITLWRRTFIANISVTNDTAHSLQMALWPRTFTANDIVTADIYWKIIVTTHIHCKQVRRPWGVGRPKERVFWWIVLCSLIVCWFPVTDMWQLNCFQPFDDLWSHAMPK